MLCINKHCHHSAFNSFILTLLLVRLSIPLLSTISITTVTLLVATNIPPNLQSSVPCYLHHVGVKAAKGLHLWNASHPDLTGRRANCLHLPVARSRWKPWCCPSRQRGSGTCSPTPAGGTRSSRAGRLGRQTPVPARSPTASWWRHCWARCWRWTSRWSRRACARWPRWSSGFPA